MKKQVSIVLTLLCIWGCIDNADPNTNASGKDELESLEMETPLDERDLKFSDVVYVPVYSDIFVDDTNQKQLLSATLSIRNTHFKDTLFVSKIDYYNTEGLLVRKYIDGPIALPPMATVNYVIEKEDDTGGAGANFMVHLNGPSKNINPLIQAIMIGQFGNKALAFTTDGYSVNPD